MDYIQTANKQVDKFGVGKHGFSPGNPTGGVLATNISNTWCDGLQMEIMSVIEGAGLTPTGASLNQMYQAIQMMIAGTDYLASVRAATIANITNLAGGAPNTLDGVALVSNNRILVKDQTTASQNGIYVVSVLGTGSNGTWVRATDADGVGELTPSTVVSVEEGTVSADTQYMLVTDGPITPGTSSIAFQRKDTGRLLRVTVFTASGTWNKGVGTNSVEVEVIGGGGGGGGSPVTSSGQYAAGGGGAAGGYARKFIAGVSSPQTITVGGGGTGVSGAAGNTGGTSSFGALVSATGGTGGSGSPAGNNCYASGGGGGAGSGGDVNINGQYGLPSMASFSISNQYVGQGGSGMFGVGGSGGLGAPGNNALNYGGGGGGSVIGPSNAAVAGGAGTAGIVIVREYA